MAGAASYLSHKKQRVLTKSCISDPFNLGSGAPQGSCLGPVLFLIYVAGLLRSLTVTYPTHRVMPMILKSICLFGHARRRLRMLCWVISKTVSDVRVWMLSNRLLINDDGPLLTRKTCKDQNRISRTTSEIRPCKIADNESNYKELCQGREREISSVLLLFQLQGT